MGVEVAALVLTAYGTAKSIQAQDAAASDRRKAAKQTAKQRELAAQEQRRQKAREERVRRAQIIQSAASTGTTGSSGELGAIGSIGTQFQAGAGFAANQAALGASASSYLQRASDRDTSAGMFGLVADLGITGFQNKTELKDFTKSIF